MTDMANVQITVRDNGPYLVRGPIELTDVEGNSFRIERETIALCRCGGSANKPFCDGTHARTGFAAATRAVQEVEAQEG
jgi:CDGSH iron-sulfur domain-containing protein 3